MFLAIIGIVILLAGVNWVYQVVHNPIILLGQFIDGDLKSANSTWKIYHHLFEEHSTFIMTAAYLGALAQVESAGNPVITPYWKWQFTTDIFKIYAPASTSAGLYQYTKATFKDAKRFCIHNHQVAFSGSFFKLTGCWFNGLYSRLWPSHAIEMTSARLHYYVERSLKKQGKQNVSLLNKQKLASIIHLCGIRRGERFAKADFDFRATPTCGSHSSSAYFSQIKKVMKRYKTISKKIFL
ncbi:MAG: lytic transglycosylase domain-containing protein [Deltaproteobacteria bacterium]|nr:lytic transglycosylase domain-containing protein [Deltaproteobacteria bacterium]MBT4641858.1 lytic transglycosylase domain-containing protein [Deltaproteobacteria bacterium]MBT6504599.1 lytic transglycosylase domain-containing protein [Deltaproteobacteria bacterium]MBT6615269.1 lytic transglycosylase domain-containing protein [Deltaproteobacteria bacterium]MBT7151216.1 lytic transglycosylase domain-containing protein [Deltaproteobacteria bacterium]